MRRTGSSDSGRSDRDDRGSGRGGAMTGRRKSRYLAGVVNIDPNDIELLSKFTTEHGKILPARFTGASAKQQRQIKRAVRRARTMGLLS